MEKQKDENGKPLTFWGGVNSSNTPEEQLLQEARNEAEKVYPTESYVNDARREGYIKCYIQQAEKRKIEAIEFADWLKNECYNYHISFDTYVWRKSNDDINSYTSEEIYDLFLQQLKQ